LIEDFEQNWSIGGWTKPDIKMWAPWRGVCDKGVDFNYFEEMFVTLTDENSFHRDDGM